eukprot:TRINITY_DN72331_c0_g1_i1.p1 TRINITY_DN72331_c0_g1~~TRINITY_DN72331_c0_g1_i1.p1  ORF type:complete len:334 (+),score=51.43 TRINITY_DN72331_c0_g1_i1:47-1003(+)
MDSSRDKAGARLAGMNMTRALDVEGSGMVDSVVLLNSLKQFDEEVFTQDRTERLLKGLQGGPEGKIRIKEFALAVNALYDATPRRTDGVEAKIAVKSRIGKLFQCAGNAAVFATEVKNEARKTDLVRAAKRSLAVARIFGLRTKLFKDTAKVATDNMMANLMAGLNNLDDEAVVTIDELSDMIGDTDQVPEVPEELTVIVDEDHLREMFEECEPTRPGKVSKRELQEHLNQSMSLAAELYVGLVQTKLYWRRQHMRQCPPLSTQRVKSHWKNYVTSLEQLPKRPWTVKRQADVQSPECLGSNLPLRGRDASINIKPDC